MPFMPWSNTLETGIDAVDHQHLWLVEAVNLLYDELGRPEPEKIVIRCLLEGLMDYISHHFALEEMLFERYAYPEAAAHKAEHVAFTTRAAEFLFADQAGEEVGPATLEFLKDWLLHHILKADMAYAPFLKAAGAAHLPIDPPAVPLAWREHSQ